MFNRAGPVWVNLLLSQTKQKLKGNSTTAYKQIPDYTPGEKRSFSWICLYSKLEGYLIPMAWCFGATLYYKTEETPFSDEARLAARPVYGCKRANDGLHGPVSGPPSKHCLSCHGGNPWMLSVLENSISTRFLKVTRGCSLRSMQGWAFQTSFPTGINMRHLEGKK